MAAKTTGAGRLERLQVRADEYVQGKSRLRGHPQVLQRFPYERSNVKTRRRFRVQRGGSSIEAVQISGDRDDEHHGTLQFKIVEREAGRVFELSHIQSDPELGSGLGSLLVYYMAIVARAIGFRTIEIPTAAPTAVGFYEHMGWRPAKPDASADLEAQLVDSDQDDVMLDRYAQHTARSRFDSDREHRQMTRRSGLLSPKTRLTWEGLSQERKDGLVEAEKVRFRAMSGPERARIIRTMYHNKAVAQFGMIGDTETIIARAFASTQNTWVDKSPPSWQKAWDSRLDTGHLTEFPRPPGE